MNIISRTITGTVMIVLGLLLIGISFFVQFVTLVYGIPLLILGIIIFLNEKEDKIEQIKFQGGKK